ncbi:MAG: hypothetical protein HUU38_01725 [Anaerolineales bacterium]|nr:hypothetical protein [Anaerolineales bacterium]
MMKNKIFLVYLGLTLLGFVMVACTHLSGIGGVGCDNGICIEMELEEPVVIGQPAQITITVETEEAKENLWINVGQAGDVSVFQPTHEWHIDTQPDQPVVLTTTLNLTNDMEGWLGIVAIAFDPAGRYVSTDETLRIKDGIVTVNPPPERDIENKPIPEPPFPIPPDIPIKPTPWDRSLPVLPPAEIMTNCGWSSNLPVSEWAGAKVYVDIPETVPVNQDIPVTVWFEMPASQPQGTVRVKFCPSAGFSGSPPFQIVGTSQWTVTLAPGQIYKTKATVRFVQTGIHSLPLGAYSSGTRQVLNGGQLVQVVEPSISIGDAGNWVQILFEGFEGSWPGAGWSRVDASDDGYERYWDEDDYQAFAGTWAAWPANGGAHAMYPQAGDEEDDDYPRNMNTRMIFGPFDLSDAELAEVTFSLLYETENDHDYLALEISQNGTNFTELGRWSGNIGSTSWTSQLAYLDDYIGDPSVWLAWRFFSDSDTIVYDGPWVDNIDIQKYVHGDVQVTGTVTFNDIDPGNTIMPAQSLKATLYEWDLDGSSEPIETVYTNIDGYYSFSPITNWEDDGVNIGPLDLFVEWETITQTSSLREVTDLNNNIYWFQSLYNYNVADGNLSLDKNISHNDEWAPAIWIFQGVNFGWKFLDEEVIGQLQPEIGNIRVNWQHARNCIFSEFPELGCGSQYFPYFPTDGIFIAHSDTQTSLGKEWLDTTVWHESGHAYMDNIEAFVGGNDCSDHYYWYGLSRECGYTEGWADFFALVVGGDPYLFAQTYNLEDPLSSYKIPPNPDTGDMVEIWVAAALYDLYDSNPDGYDQADFTFDDIWDIMVSAPHQTFEDYWNVWKAHYAPSALGENHYAIQAIYQNTIDYNTLSLMDILDLRRFVTNFPLNDAVMLSNYVSDEESLPEQMTWDLDLSNFYTADCLAILDGAYQIDLYLFHPENFVDGGSCGRIKVIIGDGIDIIEDTFFVEVLKEESRISLPLVHEVPVNNNHNPYPAPSTPAPTPTLAPYP